jgi:hypothetical protein
MDEHRADDVRNELRARRTNEWIRSSHRSFGDAGERQRYFCECSDGDCRSTISLRSAEYEAVRADGNLFAITRDHEDPELDALVVEYELYAVVGKLPGMPARMSYESDPRRRG